MAVLSVGCLSPELVHSDQVPDISSSELLGASGLIQHGEAPPAMPFAYTFPDGESLSVDFSGTLLRDNVLTENLRFKGKGQLVSVAYMRALTIDGLSLLRNGDFSLSTHFTPVSSFWEEYGCLPSGGARAPVFEEAEVSAAASVGSTMLVTGGGASTLVKRVKAVENWFWKTEASGLAVFSTMRGDVVWEEVHILSLIEGENPVLIEYLLKAHSIMSDEKVTEGPDKGVLNGILFSIWRFSWKGGSIHDVRTTDMFFSF